MKTASRLLTFALLAVLGSTSAQSITSVTGDGADPAVGGLGTTLDIVGTGFGGPTGLGKPSAFLLDPATGKKFTLSVVTFSDTEITALITKAAYGVLDVNVQPKGAALLTSAGAFTVPQPEITGVLPLDESGTIGTPVTISGTGLLGVAGLSKPKMQLFNPATGKKYAMKVSAFSATEVTATITKAIAGSLELQLIPKGGAPIVVSADFEVPLPNITLITPAFAFVNELVTLDCEDVGTAKPKVKLGNKSCKVLSYSNTLVTFLMPKKLPKGVHTLQLITKVGTATQIGAIINEGETPDVATDNFMGATFGKLKWVAGFPPPFEDLAVVGVYNPNPTPVINLTGNLAALLSGNLVTQSGALLLIPTDPTLFVDPVAFVDVAGGKIEYQIPDTTQLFAPPLARWTSDTAGGSYSIAILSVEDAGGGEVLVRGAFSATLVLVESNGAGHYAPTMAVTSGEFRTSFDPTP